MFWSFLTLWTGLKRDFSQGPGMTGCPGMAHPGWNPAHPRLDQDHSRLDPAHPRLDPTHPRLNPTHLGANPAHLGSNPAHPSMNPAHPRRNPAHHSPAGHFEGCVGAGFRVIEERLEAKMCECSHTQRLIKQTKIPK